MPRDYLLYLDDILDSVNNIRDYTKGMDYNMFRRDRKTLDAVIRNLEIIGEAATRLPEPICSKAEDIEWRKIKGLRNILIHEYFGVSLPIIWDVVQNKLETLENSCRNLLKHENIVFELNFTQKTRVSQPGFKVIYNIPLELLSCPHTVPRLYLLWLSAGVVL